jgi:chromosome segregation ATPase
VLSKEIEINKNYQQAVEQKKQQIESEIMELDKIVKLLTENEDAIKDLKALVNEKCHPNFPDKKTVNEAEEWLNNQKKVNDLNLQIATSDRKEFEKEPSIEELATQRSAKDQTNERIRGLETTVSTLTVSLDILKQEIDKINSELSTVDLEQLDTEVVDVEKQIEEKILEIRDKVRHKEVTEQLKRQIETQIQELNMTISNLQGQQNEIITQ